MNATISCRPSAWTTTQWVMWHARASRSSGILSPDFLHDAGTCFSLCDSQVTNVAAQGVDPLLLLASYWPLLSREEGGEKPFFSFFAEIRKFWGHLLFQEVETEMIQCQQLPSSSFPWLRQNSEEKSCVAISHLFFAQGFVYILGQTGQVSSKQWTTAALCPCVSSAWNEP